MKCYSLLAIAVCALVMPLHSYAQEFVEPCNVINHPAFGAPDTTATNSQFGLITAQANRARTLQLGARFVL